MTAMARTTTTARLRWSDASSDGSTESPGLSRLVFTYGDEGSVVGIWCCYRGVTRRGAHHGSLEGNARRPFGVSCLSIARSFRRRGCWMCPKALPRRLNRPAIRSIGGNDSPIESIGIKISPSGARFNGVEAAGTIESSCTCIVIIRSLPPRLLARICVLAALLARGPPQNLVPLEPRQGLARPDVVIVVFESLMMGSRRRRLGRLEARGHICPPTIANPIG